ncbi:bifunctional DNA primase/polymerase [Laceyella tengchongensis]
MKMKEMARRYFDMGLKPIPLCWPDRNGRCACPKNHTEAKNIGKAPLLGEGYQEAEVTKEKIERWWTRWPDANIGILLEPSNLLVVDLDGEEAIQEGNKRLPLSPTIISGNGEHRWFMSPGIFTRLTKRGQCRKIDILSKGYTVAPPSRHKNGFIYQWRVYPDGLEDDGMPLAPAPREIIATLEEAIRNHQQNRNFALPSDLPKVDVQREPISRYLKRLIVEGDYKGKHPSRSEAHFEAITLLISEGWSEEKIAAVLLDPAYKIGEKIQERGPGKAEEFAAREIAKAKATFDPGRIKSKRKKKAKNQAVDQTQNATSSEIENNPLFQKKHIINITDQPIHTLSEQAWEAILAQNDPPQLFVRHWMMTEVRMDKDGQAKLFEMNESGLRGRLDRCAQWVKWKKTGEDFDEVPTQPPLYVVRDMLSDAKMPLPAIKGITYAPVFSPDGMLETEPGYHEKSELYYIDHGVHVPPVSSTPSPDEVSEAIDLLINEVLIDFPFKDQASRVHALAAILLPFCRPMISGPTPLHLIDAPKRGTGKSLLARAIHMIATGQDASMYRLPKTDEETDKKIVSILREGNPVVVLDNVSGSVDSDSLNAALTSTNYAGRMLGKSEIVVLPNQALWMMTGNNVDLSGDIHRRICWIRLDAKMNKPFTRSSTQFQHPNLIGWIKGNRGLIIWASLTLIQNWLAQGKPSEDCTLGGFEEWAKVMGGILKAAGFTGFLANFHQLLEIADHEGFMWDMYFQIWWKRYGNKEISATKAWELAVKHDLLTEVLGDGNERGQRIRIGKELQRQRECIYGEFQLCSKRDNHKKAMVYWLKKI